MTYFEATFQEFAEVERDCTEQQLNSAQEIGVQYFMQGLEVERNLTQY